MRVHAGCTIRCKQASLWHRQAQEEGWCSCPSGATLCCTLIIASYSTCAGHVRGMDVLCAFRCGDKILVSLLYACASYICASMAVRQGKSDNHASLKQAVLHTRDVLACESQVNTGNAAGDARDPNEGLEHVTAPMMVNPDKESNFIAAVKESLATATTPEAKLQAAGKAYHQTVRKFMQPALSVQRYTCKSCSVAWHNTCKSRSVGCCCATCTDV